MLRSDAEIQELGEAAWVVILDKVKGLWGTVVNDAGPELENLKRSAMTFLKYKLNGDPDAVKKLRDMTARANLLASQYVLSQDLRNMDVFKAIVEVGVELTGEILKEVRSRVDSNKEVSDA